jgi:hypothetical protein
MVHGEPENPHHDYFLPLSSPNSKIFLKWFPYRLFTFLKFFPKDSLKPDLLAEEGFYLTKNQEVTCQFCYNISIPLEEARIELGGMNKTELRSWHKEKAQYCRVATNEILANDFYGNQNSKR